MRANTLEDIGRKAVEASVATTTRRRLRGVRCQRQPGLVGRIDCLLAFRFRAHWCPACLERIEAYEAHRRAKNSLLVAIRSYIRRTSAPSTL